MMAWLGLLLTALLPAAHGITVPRSKVPPENLERFKSPRIVMLGPSGAGKSTVANHLLGRAKNYTGDGRKCFVEIHAGQTGDKVGGTSDVCYNDGQFPFGEMPEILVVDTPGLAASSLIEEEGTIDRIVKVLKDDVEYVNTFAIVIKNTETRQTRDLVGTISNYRRIFGEDFIKNVILVTTFWFYGKEDAIHLPEGKQTKEESLNFFKSLFKVCTGDETIGCFMKEDVDSLRSIYFTNKIKNNTEEQNEYEQELTNLVTWSSQLDYFHCLDIQKALPNLVEAQKEIQNLKNKNDELNRTVGDLKMLEILKHNITFLEKELAKYKANGVPEIGADYRSSSAGIAVGCLLLGVVFGIFGLYFYKNNCNKVDDDDEEQQAETEDLNQVSTEKQAESNG